MIEIKNNQNLIVIYFASFAYESLFRIVCPGIKMTEEPFSLHTIYTRINMSQKCEGNCGLWVLNEILKKTYPENLKKIVGAVWELPAK